MRISDCIVPKEADNGMWSIFCSRNDNEALAVGVPYDEASRIAHLHFHEE